MHVEVCHQFTYTVKAQTHTLVHCHLLSVCVRVCLCEMGGRDQSMHVDYTKYVSYTGCLHGLLTLSSCSLIYVLICGYWQH